MENQYATFYVTYLLSCTVTKNRLFVALTLILVPDRLSGSNNRKIDSATSHTYLWSQSIYSMKAF